MSADSLKTLYDALRASAKKDLKSPTTSADLAKLCEQSLNYINENSVIVPLISRVVGKTYAMARLKGGQRSSRPINTALFDQSIQASDLSALANADTSAFGEKRLGQLLYARQAATVLIQATSWKSGFS